MTAGRMGLFALMLVGTAPAWAMRISTAGDQLILQGPVVGGEAEAVAHILDDHPNIATVILRNSPGGDAPTGYRVGAMFRARGLRTAVSGYSYSSCSRMFLGGRVRVFTDDEPVEVTNVGFHGHYDSNGHLDAAAVQRQGQKDWILQYSDGKADAALVERWVNIPSSRGMIHFYRPDSLPGQVASTFFCPGREATRSAFACEPIKQTALDLGVITSLDIISSNDLTR